MSHSATDSPTDRNSRSANVNSKLEQSLLSYAAVAAAAGVSLLALSTPSAAEVIFTPAHRTIKMNGTGALDLNNDGTVDFKVTAAFFNSNQWPHGSVNISAIGSNEFVIDSKGFAAVLSPGNPISSAAALQGGTAEMVGANLVSLTHFYTYCSYRGPWRSVPNRFVGLALNVAGQKHFGWARFTVLGGCAGTDVLLSGYAYETIPNQPILAGQKSGSDTASVQGVQSAPRAGTLGHLALGAAGKQK